LRRWSRPASPPSVGLRKQPKPKCVASEITVRGESVSLASSALGLLKVAADRGRADAAGWYREDASGPGRNGERNRPFNAIEAWRVAYCL
jgi:hypothetical protein